MGSVKFLDVLALGQHGLVVRRQLLDAGLSASAIKRWVSADRLIVLYPGVYRLAGSPPSWEQRLLAAVLAAGDGAVASHRSAARLWRVLDAEEIELTLPRSRRTRLSGVVIHRSDDVVGAHVVHRNGVPSTTPLRMLVDLGAVLPGDLVEDALDRALALRLVTVPGVQASLDAVARRGRCGAGVLRTVLDSRALGADRPDSLLEPRMARLLRRHQLPPAVFQYEVRHAGRFVARIDFAYPRVRLAIEVDGFETHSSPRALQGDLRRQNLLVGLGWRVLRFTWADVVRNPDRVAAEIERVLGSLATA